MTRQRTRQGLTAPEPGTGLRVLRAPGGRRRLPRRPTAVGRLQRAITAYRPDVAALAAAPTRVVVAVGVQAPGLLTGRTAEATAAALGQEATLPGDHGGFLGGELGQRGEPEAFAVRLRDVLDAPLAAATG